MPRSLTVLAVATIAFAASGCASRPGTQMASLGPIPAAAGATITFDSIDGPPPEVFRKLVANLNSEAQARKIPVVSREAPATYRVRGYVSAAVERGKTSFGWVWDVYDADKRRTLRIAGEEPGAPGKRRDAWAAADDALLQRMVSSGMERIAAFLGTPAEPPIMAPEAPGIALASARDDSPEAVGIVRTSVTTETTGAAPAVEPEPAPPRQKPRHAKPARRPARATTAAALAPER